MKQNVGTETEFGIYILISYIHNIGLQSVV